MPVRGPGVGDLCFTEVWPFVINLHLTIEEAPPLPARKQDFLAEMGVKQIEGC